MASVTFRLNNTNRIRVPDVLVGDEPAVGGYAPDTFTWTLYDPDDVEIGTGSLAHDADTTSDYVYDVPASVLADQVNNTDGTLVIAFVKGTSRGEWRDTAKFRTRRIGQ